MASGALIEEYSMLVASCPKKLGAVTAMDYEAGFFHSALMETPVEKTCCRTSFCRAYCKFATMISGLAYCRTQNCQVMYSQMFGVQ